MTAEQIPVRVVAYAVVLRSYQQNDCLYPHLLLHVLAGSSASFVYVCVLYSGIFRVYYLRSVTLYFNHPIVPVYYQVSPVFVHIVYIALYPNSKRYTTH